MPLDFGQAPRWLIFGGGPILLVAVEHLLAQEVSPIAICGRRHLDGDAGPSTLHQHLNRLGVRMLECADANGDPAVEALIDAETIGLSFDAPWIFKRHIIDKFGGKLLNSHGARLPQDRGGGGFSWRIMRGDRLGYSVLHQIAPKVDAGAIVALQEYLYPASCRIPQDYFDYTLERDAAFVRRFIDDVLARKTFTLASQPEYFSVSFPRLATDIHGFVDWSWELAEIESFICAFDDPYPGASSFWRGQRVRLKKAFAVRNDGAFHPFQTGLIYRKTDEAVMVACGSGALLLRDVRSGDGANSLLSQLRLGDRLYTPRENLEVAQKFRAVYDAKGLVLDRGTDADR
jgi:methionyl-tRNA formyltransferase